MDTKHIHCMLEKMAEYGKCMVEEGAGSGNVNLEDAKKIVEMVGELAEAEYHALIAKEMRKANEEDEAEEKHFLKMLKDEYKDEFKKMKEEYGEDEGERRFYDNYRYKSSGRFAPRGRGTYSPRRGGRRGYEEAFMPMDYRMDLMDYKTHSPEELRDLDREMGRLYFTPSSTGNSGMTSSSSMSGNSGNSGNDSGNTRSYTDGFNDGQTRGYSEGYERGRSDGRNSQSRDRREGRSGQMRRGYMETKEKHSDNTPESKQAKMKSLEAYMKELSEDISEMIEGASNEEKTMLRSKVQTLAQKIQ